MQFRADRQTHTDCLTILRQAQNQAEPKTDSGIGAVATTDDKGGLVSWLRNRRCPMQSRYRNHMALAPLRHGFLAIS